MGTNPTNKPRRLPAALAGAALGIGGLTGSLLLLGQSAGAQVANDPVTNQTAETADAVYADSEHGEELFDLDQIREEWAAFDGCLVDQGVVTAEEVDEMYADPETWDYDEDYDGEFDEDYDGDFEGDWVEGAAFAMVENGDELTVIEFGDADGTVTIQKNGNDIVVTSTGDVDQEVIDLDEEFLVDDEFDDYDGEWTPEMEAEAAAEMEQWDVAFETCEHLAPEGALDFTDDDLDSDHEG